MSEKLLASFADAVADIPDGASIFIGGFAGVGFPWNLIKALYEQGARDLTLIGNQLSGAGRENMITTGTIIEARRVRRLVAAFTAATHPSRRTVAEDMAESGEIETELVPQGTLAERIRAGGAGIPAFFTSTSVATELAEGKEHRVFDGRTYVMEEAITADYAFVRAWKADEFGNLTYRLAMRNFNPLMAMAARCTIVETEEIVPTGALDPNQVHTSGIFVHRVVKIGPDGIVHQVRNEGAARRAQEPARA